MRIKLPEQAIAIARAVHEAGGRALLVGGPVRDWLLGIPIRDCDFEVYGLAPEALKALLARFGEVNEVGKSFGVFKVRADDLEMDFALPRKERKTGTGHKGFAAEPDPFLDPKQAARRRDFTINAMMLDPLTGELFDFYSGRDDLTNRILRHVSEAFVEDPLRPLRGMQFAARFALAVAPSTARLCRAMLAEYATLPKERIWGEWRKWALAAHPEMGLEALEAMGWLAPYPELERLVGCPQNPRWHPEGDVWTHTKHAVRMMRRVLMREGASEEDSITLMLAALMHDLGKPLTTREENGVIRSTGHAAAGVAEAERLLARIGAPQRFFEPVKRLVREHLAHLGAKPTPRAVRRLAARLAPASLRQWAWLVEADASARPPKSPVNPAAPWLEVAEKLAVDEAPPEPIVRGRLLLALGVPPGPKMGEIIRKAYEAQLDGAFADEKDAIAWLSAHLLRNAAAKRQNDSNAGDTDRG
ncbi:MAG: HD domain-containing protein [Zetaproteobacteria bacterium]|nr:MAG: HD domain-containing protein [Zetaproteobacteria bacterium]